MKKVAVIGNKGDRVRSDCEVRLQIKDTGGLKISLESRVESMYGNRIRKLAADILSYFGTVNAELEIQDSGALDFVHAARIEAALKMLKPDDRSFLLPKHDQWERIHDPERNRITRLYLPGNTPSMMLNAGIHRPDSLILDLEDSVAPSKKHEARYLVRNALLNHDFMGIERTVRINTPPMGFDDLKVILEGNPDLLLLPKAESSVSIGEIAAFLDANEPDPGQPVLLMPIIESALGIENAFEIASAHQRVVAMAIGLEDYTADLGVARTTSGKETDYARSRLVNACRAAGIQAIDSVYSDVDNEQGLKDFAEGSRALGFEGMGCIHPRQITVGRTAYLPGQDEIEKAERIVNAYQQAEIDGSGVVSLDSKMIDLPVVKRAQKLIRLAVENGLISDTATDE